MKDACASDDELFDLEAEKAQDRMSQVLNIPVSDFELSVRSRNCLTRMGVETLGDLARSTEQELLGSKNFGETSLIEIRDMLTSKGLALGQFAHESRPEREVDRSHVEEWLDWISRMNCDTCGTICSCLLMSRFV